MKNVLLVDDDSIFNFISTSMLKRTGMVGEIHTALNGKQALDLLNNYYMGTASLPNVILLDLNMPIMDGFSFLEAFKKISAPRKETIRIIVVTSSHDPGDRKRAEKMGISLYLTKPLTEEVLRKALEG
ncbi:MAG TPA: response regulator [Cyclobacteriaceae bacterium]|jgi:CheY-like chemotaxis protein